jgi:hypothetical protein
LISENKEKILKIENEKEETKTHQTGGTPLTLKNEGSNAVKMGRKRRKEGEEEKEQCCVARCRSKIETKIAERERERD